MERIQIIAITGSIFFLSVIFELIRRKLLKEAYAILWLFFGIIFIILSCWRRAIDYFSKLVGIYYPPAMLLLFLIFALIIVLVQFSVVVSQQNDKIRKLAQKIALLEEKLSKKE